MSSLKTMSAFPLPRSVDYSIVGVGNAGCVLADRLSEDPTVEILVLESGTRMVSSPQVRDPQAWEILLESSADWHFHFVSQVWYMTVKEDLP